jgi:gluconolactonase
MPADTLIYDTDVAVFANLETEKMASGFQFTEGPVWHHNGFLLFSDTPANKVYRLFPGHPPAVFIDNSGYTGTDMSLLSDMIGSNGLAWDGERLIICQHGNHAIACLDINNRLHILTNNYNGRPFNSPNDLAISTDGSIYFTDPPYGLKNQVLHPAFFQSSAGLYRYYNGVCFSPDEEFLYTGSNHPDEPFIWRLTLSENGEIKNQSLLIEHNADGIKTDEQGRIFLATNEGILIVSPEGKKLALLALPEIPSNLAWGGRNGKELYVTARSSVYRIRNF